MRGENPRMGAFVFAQRNLSPAPRSQDRVAVTEQQGGILVALADGAGGVAGGEEASWRVVAKAEHALSEGVEPTDAAAWCALLGTLDGEIEQSNLGGETTGVILWADANGIAGASVGDSEAWLVLDAGFEDLSVFQRRKPLLGTGEAVPTPFQARPWSGTLLVASDGLTKYAPVEALLAAARGADLEAAADRLVDLVRLRSGALQDDVSLALVRRA